MTQLPATHLCNFFREQNGNILEAHEGNQTALYKGKLAEQSMKNLIVLDSKITVRTIPIPFAMWVSCGSCV